MVAGNQAYVLDGKTYYYLNVDPSLYTLEGKIKNAISVSVTAFNADGTPLSSSVLR